MILATTESGHRIRATHAINRGQWFGKTWLLTVPLGNFSRSLVVEADSMEDAIDEVADSRRSYWIDTDETCEACERNDFDNCRCSFAGNDSHRVNLDCVSLERCTVNYFAKSEFVD